MIQTDRLPQLIQGLVHPDSAERRSAAEELAGADERAAYPLIKALRDENPGVQDAAMRSLISIGGEATAYMILPLLREGPFLRNTAMVILKEIGEEAVPLFRSMLYDKDDDIRKFAVDLICEIQWCDYPQEVARVLETDPNPNVRASAAKAAGILRHRDALPTLMAALKDDEWVCFSALEALAALKDESSVEAIGALLEGRSPTTRYAAIEALGKIASPRASDILLAYLPKADDMEKTAVIKSLVEIGITPSMAGVSDVLINMLMDGDWDERLIALKGLVNLREESAIPNILDVAGSLDPSMPESEERLFAVKHALMNFGCATALINALNNPSIKFRGRVVAIDAIGDLGCKEAAPYLIRMLDSKVTRVVLSAVNAIARISGKEARAILSPLRNHGDEAVREEVERLLGHG